MLRQFPQINGDALIYGGLAKNLLLHGQYAITDGSGALQSTLIRLPGYPLFLALCFSLFGMEHYNAVGYLQIALELAGCLFLADFVRRIASPAAAHCTLWLAALCPFTAVYAGAPLTETPTLFAIALALWCLERFNARPAWPSALLFTAAVTFAAMLRPDGALVAVALSPALLISVEGRGFSPRRNLVSTTRIALVCVLLAMTPFAAWTLRNWQVFHVFEPLAPRYATDPGEDANTGWIRWVKTWCLDFVSTYDIYWNVPGNPLDLSKLPSRAFDSPAQHAETAALVAAYEDNGEEISPALDARFAQLADERIVDHPLRYYVLLPLGRVADMGLRPRVENLPIDLDWWVYSHHNDETRFSWFYAALNASYLALGIAGLCLRPRFWRSLLAYALLRSALLTTVEAPEARYTLECFPMLFVLGGIALQWLTYVVWRSVFKVKASPGRL
jgi:multisubunit Na+/H+ antiporter MnhB subunit